MYICHRHNNRYYQRLRAEHIAEELRSAPAGLDEETPPPKETELTRQREASEQLRERYGQLFGLRHSQKVVPWLDDWAVLERTAGAAERHGYLESFLRRVQSRPEVHGAEITFLLAIFEPLRLSVMHALRDATISEPTDLSAIPRHRREEAKMLAQVEANELDNCATQALLEVFARYPAKPPKLFFPWIKNAIAHRLLNVLRDELHGSNPQGILSAEHAAMTNALADIEELEPPDLAPDSPARRDVQRVADLERLPALAGQYSGHSAVKEVCRRAIGRLAPRQREVAEDVLLGGDNAELFAEQRHITRSTVNNHASQARSRLREDDVFFVELHRMRIVRDQARLAVIQARYPTGYMSDGRRRISIAA
jgi:DNA-directed RNA polymerase specialized sigma24 family protein